MDASKLRKGQKVRLTFEGVIALHDFKSVSFKHPDSYAMPLNWSDRLNPTIEILDYGLKDGDVGIWTAPLSGRKRPVVFRRFPNKSSDGWYSLTADEFLAQAELNEVELVIRADGTKVD